MDTVSTLINLSALLALMVSLWGVSLVKRDVSIVDAFWGFGFVLVAWISCATNWPVSQKSFVIATLVTIWGLRLSGFLFWRKFGEPEDARYGAMRKTHGDRFWWVSLLTVFGLQAVLIWFISLPVQVTGGAAESAAMSFDFLDWVGLSLWAVGFFFESVGDWQLAQFKSNPQNQGKVLDTGLWRYTRHPNYNGDYCVWWGSFFLSVSSGGLWTILSPVVMSVLLLKVSGVSLLEKDIAERRPEYEAYKKRTSAFFPWIPSSKS